MNVVAFTSAKHAPGVTTTALAFATAAAETRDVLLIEADAAGGDLAARIGLSFDPGLATLAAAGRHGIAEELVDAHAQRLPSGVRVLLASTEPAQVATALRSVGPTLMAYVRGVRGLCFIDLGRFDHVGPARPLLDAADLLVWVLRPTIEGVEHVRARLAATDLRQPVALLLVGTHPYSPSDVGDAVGVASVFAVDVDERAAAFLSTGNAPDRWLRRTALMRSASSLVAAFEAADLAVRVVTAAHTPDESLVRRVRQAVATELSARARRADVDGAAPTRARRRSALARQLVNVELEPLANEAISGSRAALDDDAEEALARAVFDRLFQLGRLQPLLDDERIQNIIANGCDQVFVEYADGTKVQRARASPTATTS